MHFETFYLLLVWTVFIGVVFTTCWLSWLFFKNVIQMFSIRKINLKGYHKRLEDRDKVITRNTLESIFNFLGILLMIWGFTFWGLLQFESTSIFIVPLNEILSARVLFFIGFSWNVVVDLSLFSRKVEYSRGKDKENH